MLFDPETWRQAQFAQGGAYGSDGGLLDSFLPKPVRMPMPAYPQPPQPPIMGPPPGDVSGGGVPRDRTSGGGYWDESNNFIPGFTGEEPIDDAPMYEGQPEYGGLSDWLSASGLSGIWNGAGSGLNSMLANFAPFQSSPQMSSGYATAGGFTGPPPPQITSAPLAPPPLNDAQMRAALAKLNPEGSPFPGAVDPMGEMGDDWREDQVGSFDPANYAEYDGEGWYYDDATETWYR